MLDVFGLLRMKRLLENIQGADAPKPRRTRAKRAQA
jgi:hypothetical protein